MQVARAHARTAPPHLPAGFPEALSELIQDAIAATDEAEQVESNEAPALVDLSSL